MTAAMARVRATYSNAGDHRENAANAAVAMVAIEPSTANHMSDVALCGAISRYNEAVLPPGPSNHFDLTPKRARMEGFNILDYVPRFPEAFEALGRWQSEGKLVQKSCGCRCTLPRANQAYGSDCAAAAMGRLWRGRRDIPSAAFRQGRAHDF